MPKRYTPNDKWSRRAAEEGYRARSVYKLMEIDDRFRLLKPGMSVLDLGAAPGSWSQYAAEQVGPKGKVTSVDLSEIEPIEGVTTFVADITDNDALDKILPEMVGLVISDLAPKTSGIQDVDQWKSIELSQSVLETVRKRLKPGGKCVIKVLRGADFDEFLKECKEEWTEVKTFQARASRDRSKEIYVILTN
ncbi:MAG: RlmE family RNA methyltransferase [Candidatus Peribacter sp.]|nr:RlmE family RNA methyltransferase [Candidatus Peribacter sp.]MBT4392942.1 RlmE family RNA methyltransferase [Candidatus Peribacter sp.]MBT4601002.1 RlmE family RNA methyltransferase [Candidatus Peribacter sp.]MBT5149044.1 RlmE family RNA methyltransferase [Candidatus Peribacter sp.]MBT5637368.1 RlmE family RNA methyltransferase [Candidatus Peribacter sp.]